MHLSALYPAVAVGLFAVLPTDAALGAESLRDAVAEARRELEIAKIKYRLYRQVEYQREKRQLDAAIRLTAAEVDALEERVRRFERMDDLRYDGHLFHSQQKAELALLEAELRLENLRQERLALRRFFADRSRLLELKVASARARLAELERERLP